MSKINGLNILINFSFAQAETVTKATLANFPGAAILKEQKMPKPSLMHFSMTLLKATRVGKVIFGVEKFDMVFSPWVGLCWQ